MPPESGTESIDLNERAYEALEAVRGADETFSDAVLRLVEDEDSMATAEEVDVEELAEEERAVYDLLQRHFRATDEENLTEFVETMHPTAASEQMVQQTQQLWEQYDLDNEFTVPEIQVEGDQAAAEVVQTVRKVSGPAFQDNRSRFVYQLLKHEGEWRIAATEGKETNYLE